MATKDTHIVVFHQQYFSDIDNGCRVYEIEEGLDYLDNYPTMGELLGSFPSEREADIFAESQPYDIDDEEVKKILPAYWMDAEMDDDSGTY